jgi:hypothetical protein
MKSASFGFSVGGGGFVGLPLPLSTPDWPTWPTANVVKITVAAKQHKIAFCMNFLISHHLLVKV